MTERERKGHTTRKTVSILGKKVQRKKKSNVVPGRNLYPSRERRERERSRL